MPFRHLGGLYGASNAARRPKALFSRPPPNTRSSPPPPRPEGLLGFLAWPALLLSHRPPRWRKGIAVVGGWASKRVCSFVASWPDQKSKQRGAHGYFNRLLSCA